MKKFILLGIIIALLISVPGFSEDVSDILTKMEKAGNYETAYMKSKMIIERSGKTLSEMEILSIEKKDDPDKELIRFLSPNRLKGTGILIIGKNVWYYNNRTKRVRRLGEQSKKGSMMGTSFTYEDLTAKYSEDFNGEIIKSYGNYYILKLLPKEENTTYKYLIVKVNKNTYIPEKVEYYNERGLKFKEMWQKDIENIDKRFFPLTIIMKDIENGKTTYVKTDKNSVRFNISLEDELFTIRTLKNPMLPK